MRCESGHAWTLLERSYGLATRARAHCKKRVDHVVAPNPRKPSASSIPLSLRTPSFGDAVIGLCTRRCFTTPCVGDRRREAIVPALPYSTAGMSVLSSLRMDYGRASQAWCEYAPRSHVKLKPAGAFAVPQEPQFKFLTPVASSTPGDVHAYEDTQPQPLAPADDVQKSSHLPMRLRAMASRVYVPWGKRAVWGTIAVEDPEALLQARLRYSGMPVLCVGHTAAPPSHNTCAGVNQRKKVRPVSACGTTWRRGSRGFAACRHLKLGLYGARTNMRVDFRMRQQQKRPIAAFADAWRSVVLAFDLVI
ncbi:hypothetical protein C8Q74DRAFT_675997 [Fomes fomentarius]|nr:hypothetical protein C8Q74DRAFT_675997 [Fomes fomentarius]